MFTFYENSSENLGITNDELGMAFPFLTVLPLCKMNFKSSLYLLGIIMQAILKQRNEHA